MLPVNPTGTVVIGMEARRAAFLLINEKISRQSDREWWKELIAEQKAAYDARQEQLKESSTVMNTQEEVCRS